MFKFTIRTALVLLLLAFVVPNFAHAQNFSPFFGVGSATDSAGTSKGTCPSGQISDDGTPAGCEPAGTIGGVWGVFGADFMIKPHLGVNAEYSFAFAQSNFLPNLGLKVRPELYDFNAVWEPVSGSSARIVPVLEAGVGGVRIVTYSSGCQAGFCQTLATGVNANHFQVHGGVGVELYVKGNIFIKPQFDFHYSPHLTDQYGRDWVPRYTVSVGYTFGER